MREKHVVLRNVGSLARDVLTAGPQLEANGLPAPGEVHVAVEELERKEIPKLARDREVVAIAPAIPLRLIAPFEASEHADASTADAWGIAAVGADTSPFTGEGVTVAVLDTGIDATHPAFPRAEIDIIAEDFTGEGTGDEHGHGTHCAGTIFGRKVDGRRIGIAPGVKRALIGKVLGARGGGSSDQIVKAIQWAVERGANVISMSLGIDFPGLVDSLRESGLPVELATSRALEGYRANVLLFERLASLIRAQGLFGGGTAIVAAAGNESQRDRNPNFEIAVSPPAVAEGIVSVAALGRGKNGMVVAPFSNTGANVAAPGVDILSAKRGGGLVTMSGTSMATPHVAGVAALWAERSIRAGRLSGPLLTANVIGTAKLRGLDSKVDVFDVGAGVVRAPQD